ncbi:hypothetical protein C8Q75DRAFT_806291 [Abortiporus biennis]|nr:hypothetical protein C8Q75DRAFT_806291 [Abortiporus biennis]
MFFNAFQVASVLACLFAAANAADSSAPPPPQVSTFKAPKVVNTVLPEAPFLTVVTTTVTWTETISATATSSA